MESLNEIFDPEGSGYDMESALKAGFKADETGHWATRIPSGPEEGLILKGMKHKTIGLSKAVDEKMGYKWIKKNGRYYSIKQKMEPIPFDIDEYMNSWNASQPKEKIAENRDSAAKVLHSFTRPFLATGYNAANALNRGLAGFSAHLDSMSDYVALSTGTEKGGLFENAAKIYEENADYWKDRADKVGSSFLDELIGEAAGGFVPGVSQFVLDVASGLTFPYMDGAAEAYKKDESPFIGGMVEAAKTGTLAAIFRMISPLKQYLRAPTMGTVFGIQEMEGAPEGQKAKAFVKGAAIGAGYSMSSPGGQMGLNEVREAARPAIKEFQRKLAEQEGAIEVKKPEKETPKRQRKFLKTIEESADIDPTLADKVGKVEPQDYFIQPNIESFGNARARIEEKGITEAMDFVKSDVSPSAEKGALFHELIKDAQKRGDWDTAIELIETFDRQARESGRMIQTASIWANTLTPEGFIRWANKQLKGVESKYGWADTIFKRKPESFSLSKEEQKIIMEKYREINQMPEGIDKNDAMLELIDMVAQKVPPGVSELIDAYRYQNMLSSPKTQERNIGENTFNTFITAPVDITTKGAIDYFKSILTGKEREAYVLDTPVYMKAAINALPNAIRGFTETMKLSRGVQIGKPELGIEAKTEFEAARMRQIPTALTIVSRFMEAADKFNMALIGAGEMAVQKKRGLSDADAYKKANQVAQEYLYRAKIDPKDPRLSYPSQILSSLGKMIEGTRKLPGLGTLSKWYVPFVRTPLNKGIQMVEHSPLSLMRDPRGLKNAEVQAKLLSGSIITALGAITVATGQTTWAPPTDPKEKELFYASGRKPFSVRVGDKWIPVWYLGPFALAFGIPMAIKHYTQDRKQSLTQGGIDKLISIADGLAQFIGSQTSTQSIGALFSALSGDIDFTFSSQTGFTVQQIVPATSMVRYINTILDPVYRHPKGFVEKIEANLPVLSKNLDSYHTPLFEESERETINYFLPYDVGTSKELYEGLLPFERYQARQRYLEGKINAIARQVKNNEMTPEESIGEMMKILQAQPESFMRMGKELLKLEKAK